MSRKLSYDTWLFAAALLIVVIGLVMIYSASAIITTQKVGLDNPYYFITRQCIWLLGGSALMLILMHVDLSRLRDRRVIYAAMGVLGIALVVVLFHTPVNGTHRWIVLPSFRLQPSEFAKPVIVLFLASFLARRESRINEVTSTLLPLGSRSRCSRDSSSSSPISAPRRRWCWSQRGWCSPPASPGTAWPSSR